MKYGELRMHLMETNTEPWCPRCKMNMEYVDYVDAKGVGPTKEERNPNTEGSLYKCERCDRYWLEQETTGKMVPASETGDIDEEHANPYPGQKE